MEVTANFPFYMDTAKKQVPEKQNSLRFMERDLGIAYQRQARSLWLLQLPRSERANLLGLYLIGHVFDAEYLIR